MDEILYYLLGCISIKTAKWSQRFGATISVSSKISKHQYTAPPFAVETIANIGGHSTDGHGKKETK